MGVRLTEDFLEPVSIGTYYSSKNSSSFFFNDSNSSPRVSFNFCRLAIFSSSSFLTFFLKSLLSYVSFLSDLLISMLTCLSTNENFLLVFSRNFSWFKCCSLRDFLIKSNLAIMYSLSEPYLNFGFGGGPYSTYSTEICATLCAPAVAGGYYYSDCTALFASSSLASSFFPSSP